MKRLSLAALLLSLSVSPALAAGYDDYARGVAANLRRDNEDAIAAFTAALNAGDLSAGLKPGAYYGRGAANVRAKHCTEAVADFDAAIAARPGYFDAILGRASANDCLKKYDAANADFAAAIALNPLKESIYVSRAGMNWRRGAYADAATDLRQLTKLDSSSAYALLLLAAAEARAGMLDAKQIAAAERDVRDNDGWPLPLISLYAGTTGADDAIAAANKGKALFLSDRQCDAYYFVAEWHLARGDKAAAKPLLEKALATCSPIGGTYDDVKDESDKLKS